VLTIWGRLNSHNVKKVAWFAREIGIPHVRRDVGGAFGMDAAYLALNPNALVPTIEDGDIVLWESNAILRYMAARYAAADFWPDDPAERARADKWMDWQFSYADAQRDAFLHLVRHAPEDRDPARIARSAQQSAAMMARIERALDEHPWLSGPAFGLGDIPMGVYVHSWMTLDIERPAMPNVERWYAALKARPGYASQVMIPLT
jgi:glutathione S-transferase